MYTVTQGTFRTPRGAEVSLSYRADSSDYNTIRSCLDEDEYRLADLNLTGTALDVGAHIGGATIALAVDNPALHVVAVEAVPPNVDLLRQNVERNGLSERVTVIHAAAGKGATASINWGFTGSETATHHAFIGNSLLPDREKSPHDQAEIPVRTLASLAEQFGPFSFAKVDCEGCEYPFLTGSGLEQVALIRGEFHATPTRLARQLVATHDVTHDDQTPGAFEAVRRA